MITRRVMVGAIALTGLAGVVRPRWVHAHDASVRDAHRLMPNEPEMWPRVLRATLIEDEDVHKELGVDEGKTSPRSLVDGDLWGVEARLFPTAGAHAYFRAPMRGIITQVFVAGILLPGPGGDVQTIEDLMLARVDVDDFVACGRLGFLKIDRRHRSYNVMVNGIGIASGS